MLVIEPFEKAHQAGHLQWVHIVRVFEQYVSIRRTVSCPDIAPARKSTRREKDIISTLHHRGHL